MDDESLMEWYTSDWSDVSMMKEMHQCWSDASVIWVMHLRLEWYFSDGSLDGSGVFNELWFHDLSLHKS